MKKLVAKKKALLEISWLLVLVNETWVLALLLRDLFSAWRDLEWGSKDAATSGATKNICSL